MRAEGREMRIVNHDLSPGEGTDANVRFRIRRYDPTRGGESYWAQYQLNARRADRILDGLRYIKEQLDGTLAFRSSCGHGICGSDAMLINGRNRLACRTFIRELGKVVTVEPLRGFRVIKDLVVDLEPFFEKYRAVHPFLINNDPPPARERLQTPEQLARYEESTKCILCAACTTACPIFWADGRYLGPAAILAAHRFMFDSRDQAADDRMAVLAEGSGVFRCHTIFNCTDACPRGIDVTNAIQEVKRALLRRMV